MTNFQRNLLSLAVLSCVGSTCQAALPFYPQAVETLKPDDARVKGRMHLRVSVAKGDDSPDGQVWIGQLSVCSRSACYRPAPIGKVDLRDTAKGTATVIAEMAVPPEAFTSVHFESLPGPGTVAGDIDLSPSLDLADGYYYMGGEILIVLKKALTDGRALYAPMAAACGLLLPPDPSVASVFYVPKTPVLASLRYGVTLSIPGRATPTPQIFSTRIHDAGAAFPMVDIFPVVRFTVPASLAVPEMSRAAGEGVSGVPRLTGRKVSLALPQTGLVTASLDGARAPDEPVTAHPCHGVFDTRFD